MTGSVYDSYVAALRHEKAAVPDEATRIGVVRKATPWFYSVVDENVPALGPPTELLEETKARQAELEAEGLDDAEAHNRAMVDVEFEARYADYLDENTEAREALDALRTRVEDGEDVVLVCYENTEEKRCHRVTLRERLRERLPG